MHSRCFKKKLKLHRKSAADPGAGDKEYQDFKFWIAVYIY